jgi:hypothetical protein
MLTVWKFEYLKIEFFNKNSLVPVQKTVIFIEFFLVWFGQEHEWCDKINIFLVPSIFPDFDIINVTLYFGMLDILGWYYQNNEFDVIHNKPVDC